jgi:hypothetical protein
MMDTFDIHIAYIVWGDDGKRRPVVIYSATNFSAVVFRITTQYFNKSVAVRSKYISITDCQQAGLHKQSYIDINAAIKLPTSSIDSSPIGKLTERDRQALLEALEE